MHVQGVTEFLHFINLPSTFHRFPSVSRKPFPYLIFTFYNILVYRKEFINIHFVWLFKIT